MIRILTAAVIGACATAALLAQRPALQLPPRDSPSPSVEKPVAAARGEIAGRVVTGDSGRPLRRALVRLNGPALPGGRTNLTDDTGAFRFGELPAGLYYVNVSRPGFVSLAYGQRRPLQPGTPLQLAEGQQLRNVDVRLPRGSAIAGRVFDEDGEPMPAANLRVTRLQYVQGVRQLVQAGNAQTDDRGQYRVWGLMPGDYYVSAVARPIGPNRGRGRGGPDPGAANDDEVGYAPTFYPGVTAPGDARPVRVGLGAEALDIDFGVVLVQTATVAGRVLFPEGSAAGSGTASLFVEPAIGSPLQSAPIRQDGNFAFRQVPPGRYTLRARTNARVSAAAFGIQSVVVSGSGSVTDLVVSLSAGATLTGRVATPSMESLPANDARLFSVGTMPAEPGGFPAGGSARIQPDGTFTVSDVPPGLRTLRVQSPPGWALESAAVDGSDIADAPIAVRAGQRIGGIALSFTNRLTEINGTVTTGNGTPVSDYTVIAFAADAARWRPDSRYIRTTRPDQNGRYLLRGLPAGDYLLAIIDPTEPGQWFDPAYLEEQRAAAVRVTLTEAGVRTQDLKR